MLIGSGLGKGRVTFRGSFGGLSLTLPPGSSSCWEQSEGGIMFLLVTLPRMRGNPQSVGFGGWGGDRVAGDGMGKLNCFIVNMLRYFFLESVLLKGTVYFPCS